jgi:hypothetical protein
MDMVIRCMIVIWGLLLLSGCSDNGLGFSFTTTIAYAGEDRVIGVGQREILDGTNSKYEGGSDFEFSWVLVSGPPLAIENADSSQAAIIPLTVGEYAFQLTVMDSRGVTSMDEVIITVQELADLSETGNVDITGSFEP